MTALSHPSLVDTVSRWPAVQSMRSWLADLDRHGELGRVDSPVDAGTEVAAVLERLDGRRAVLFARVAGAGFPLAGNLVLGRDQLARALGGAGRDAAERYARALSAPRRCQPVPPADAPVLAHRLDPEALLARLPLPVQHEHDAGRYLTAALLVVRDPATGHTNLSINRMLAAGGSRLRTLVLPGRLGRILADAERRGTDLAVAVVLGVDPLLALASQAPPDPSIDDLEVASALHQTPLPVVPAPVTGLPVPAEAEFVLEGRFRAGVREPEGPFGEFPRTYGPAAPAPVVELSAGWHRTGATAQTILSGGREHFLLGGVPREAALLRTLRRAQFDVAAVRLPEAGSCRLHAVVALRDPAPGVAVNALLATLGASRVVKQAVVVDDDVDVFDDEQIGWAVATRVQADRDLLVIAGAAGSSLDPSARESTTAKLGIDATVGRHGRDRHARMRTAPAGPGRIDRLLAEAGRADASAPPRRS